MLELLATDAGNRLIAERLNVDILTVKSHVTACWPSWASPHATKPPNGPKRSASALTTPPEPPGAAIPPACDGPRTTRFTPPWPHFPTPKTIDNVRWKSYAVHHRCVRFVQYQCDTSWRWIQSTASLNGLVAADAVMIPMQCEYYALEGLSDLVETIRKVRKHLNPRLEIEGLLRTMYDPRNSLAQQVSAQLQQHFGDKLYATIIPRNVRLAEAPSYGAPAVNLDKACKGSQAYMALADELLSRSAVALA